MLRTTLARFFGSTVVTNEVEEKTSPVLQRAALSTEAVKVKVTEANKELEHAQGEIREQLKRQEAVRQATAAFKGSVKDLEKAVAAVKAAEAKAVAAVDKTAALEEQLAEELFAWEYGSPAPVSMEEEVLQEAEIETETPEAAPAVAEEEVLVEAKPVQPAWDGHSVADLTAEQREAMGL